MIVKVTITRTMRDLLLEHLDGQPVPVKVKVRGARSQLVGSAIRFGYICYDRLKRPKHTFITEKGRHRLARALSDWAEATILAERTKDETIIAALAAARAKGAETPVVSHDMARAEP